MPELTPFVDGPADMEPALWAVHPTHDVRCHSVGQLDREVSDNHNMSTIFMRRTDDTNSRFRYGESLP